MAKKLLVWLGKKDSDNSSLVGEKVTLFGKLAKLGFPILPGFVITKTAFQEFINTNALNTRILHLQGSIEDKEKQKKAIQKELDRASIPHVITDELLQAFLKLSGQLKNIPLHVTPSSTKTPRIVIGEANLVLEVKKIWEEQLQDSTHPVAIVVQSNPQIDELGIYHSEQQASGSTLPKKEKHRTHFLQLMRVAKKEFYFPQTFTWIITKDQLYITDVKDFTPKIQEIRQTHASLTATKIYLDISRIENISELAQKNTDGIGILRLKNVIQSMSLHPKNILDKKRKKEFIEKLSFEIEKIAKAFSPRVVVYTLSNFTTEEYAQMEGGKQHEATETNPLLGYRGALRFVDDPEIIALELEAIAHTRNKANCKNVWLMLPFIRTVEELQEAKKLVASFGLYRSPSFKIWMGIEIPSNVILLEDYISQGIDGVSIGSTHLTALMLGLDKNNETTARFFNEQDPSLLWAYQHTIRLAHKHNIMTSFYGRATAYPKLLQHLVENGVSSISVAPDAVDITREMIARYEKEKAA